MSESTYKSHSVKAGNIEFGGENNIFIQSMTNTNTNDIDLTVNQCVELYDAGCEVIRITTQGEREVKALAEIVKRLRSQNIYTPIVADVHFLAKVAIQAAYVADKVRINPGNYLKFPKKGNEKDFQFETEIIAENLRPLFKVCSENGTAIRIGVNQGSLSERIRQKYGDSPAGMAESAFEFAQICDSENFRNVVFSLKSSNVNNMIQSYKLLIDKFLKYGYTFPFHLGVTEAGNKLQGIVKSSVGIGALLEKGIGDTIRVSLTGNPIDEIPIAKHIVERYNQNDKRKKHCSKTNIPFDEKICLKENLEVDIVGKKDDKTFKIDENGKVLNEVNLEEQGNGEVLYINNDFDSFYKFCVNNSIDIGKKLIYTKVKSIVIESNKFPCEQNRHMVFSILQSLGLYNSEAEIIACPSCGRTLFNIEEQLALVQESTRHLKHLKIAVMGCIVNGVGEMADADYGYIGSGKNSVDIFKGKARVASKVPENEAIKVLIDTIKENGDWIEKIK